MMGVYIKGIEMPKSCLNCFLSRSGCRAVLKRMRAMEAGTWIPANYRHDDCPLVPVPPHGRLIDADALTEQMERNLWAIEDKAEKELGFDETLRRGMQYGNAVCLNAVNDATVIFVPQIVHCRECEYNNHCLTQEFVEDASKIPFDKNTWFCADAKVAPTIIPAEDGE